MAFFRNTGRVWSDEFRLADRAWRTSLLLVGLLERDGVSMDQLTLVLEKCSEWIARGTPECKAVGLNVMRSLFKASLVPSSRDLEGAVATVVATDASLAVRLAALDFLGAMNALDFLGAKNLTSLLVQVPSEDMRKILEFRSNLMKKMNASQRAYLTQGIHEDVAAETRGRLPGEALRSVISRVDGIA